MPKLICVECGKDISDSYDILKLLGIIDDKTNIDELNKIIRCSDCHYNETPLFENCV